MNPPRVFISHTSQGELDREVTVTIAIELRRMDIDVWLDWEHPAPNATNEQQTAKKFLFQPLHGVFTGSRCSTKESNGKNIALGGLKKL